MPGCKLEQYYKLVLSVIVILTTSLLHAQNEIPSQEHLLKQQQDRLDRQINQEKLDKQRQLDKSYRPSDSEEEIEQPSDYSSKNTDQCFILKKIVFKGANLLSKRLRKKLSKDFIGKCISPTLLRQVVKRVSNHYLTKGYVTTRVFLDAQNIKSGILEVLVLEGKLNTILFDTTISKNGFFSRTQLISSFGCLRDRILNIRDIEQGLDQLNRLTSNNATMRIIPSDQEGYSNIVVSKNKRTRSTRLKLGGDNSGQEQTGLYNGKVVVEQDNLLGLSDFMYGSFTHDLSFKKGEKYATSFYLSLDIPFGKWNMSSSVSSSSYQNTTQGTNTTIKTSGNTLINTYQLDRRLFRNKVNKIGLSASLTLRDTKSYIEDVQNDVGSRKLSVASVGLNHSINSSIGYFNYTLSCVLGLDAFGAKKDAGILDEFTPRAQYQKYTFSFSYYLPIQIRKQNFYVQSYLSSQYALDPLFSSEQISIGDAYSVRGFRDKSIFGDNGFYVTNTFNYRLPGFITEKLKINQSLRNTELFFGYDYGYVWQKGGNQANNGEGIGGLSGISGGCRYNSRYFQFHVTYAKSVRTESFVGESNELYFNVLLKFF